MIGAAGKYVSMPGQSYRSKLNPHLDFIREARLREETWEEISRQINERGTATDRSQVCKFFLRRAGGRRPAGFAPDPAGPTGPAASTRTASGTRPGVPPEEDLLETPGRSKLVIKVSQ
jgi:hypothetical protein